MLTFPHLLTAGPLKPLPHELLHGRSDLDVGRLYRPAQRESLQGPEPGQGD